jgi:hypothetical protein
MNSKKVTFYSSERLRELFIERIQLCQIETLAAISEELVDCGENEFISTEILDSDTLAVKVMPYTLEDVDLDFQDKEK